MYFKLETRITYPKEKANSRMLSFVRVANIIRRTNIHVVYTAVQNNEIKHFVKTNGKSQTAKEGFLDSQINSKTSTEGSKNPKCISMFKTCTTPHSFGLSGATRYEESWLDWVHALESKRATISKEFQSVVLRDSLAILDRD